MAILTILMCFASTSAFAQLKEVRGVQTRVVEYQGQKKLEGLGYQRHGFEFKNENNYAVWVEAELYSTGFVYNYGREAEGTKDTKSFTLKAGETYVWKCGDKMEFEDGAYYHHSDYSENYYVKYKAYRAE